MIQPCSSRRPGRDAVWTAIGRSASETSAPVTAAQTETGTVPGNGRITGNTAEPGQDLPVPGRKATFGVIQAAQARGDFRVLAERGRRVLRAHIAGEVAAGLAEIDRAARRALG